ncbi:hypothetical protein NIES3974_30090 [Calothrix sp. NIES-3974]|nr:hypothetical protein NIES3974_30090 [Calothrix sp. NIES-3974]
MLRVGTHSTRLYLREFGIIDIQPMNPSTLPPDIALALDDFANSTIPGVWKSVEKTQLIAQMRDRIVNPFQINQGGQPFCGPASIIFELVRKQPLKYIELCRSLFETGTYKTGNIHIQTSPLLRRSQGKLRTQPTDWMVLSALREAENSIFNIEANLPDFVRNLAGITKPWEMETWTKELLGYQKVTYHRTYFSGEFQALQAATKALQNQGVVFPLVTADGFLRAKTPFLALPNHWIVLLGNISVQGGEWLDTEPGKINLDVYSWGKQYRIHLPEEDFGNYFWGVVIGE